MNIRNDDIQTLMELGLTQLQAKIYLALSTLENATIKMLSETTNVSKQDVYRIISKLQQLGLTQKIIAPQATYKAVPIEYATTTLFQQKIQQYNNLRQKTIELVKHFKDHTELRPLHEEDSKFIIISDKKVLFKMLDEKNRAVQKSLDAVGTWEGTKGALFRYGLEDFKIVMKRGAKFRWITEIHKEDQQVEKRLKMLQENPLFEIRYLPLPIPLRAAIYDQKEASMGLSQMPEEYSTSLWSNNLMFVRIVSRYYETLWNRASRDNSEKIAPKISEELACEVFAKHHNSSRGR